MLEEKKRRRDKIEQRASFIKGMKFSANAPPLIPVSAHHLDLGYADANITSQVTEAIESRSKWGEILIWNHTGERLGQTAQILMERNDQKDITHANPQPFKADIHIVAKAQLDAAVREADGHD